MLEKQESLALLENKLTELKKIEEDGSVDISAEIEMLQEKISKMQIEIWNHLEPWDRVQLARHAGRLTGLDYIENIFEEFREFHGDRFYRDDASIVGGIAFFEGKPVTIIAQQKGRNTKDNIKRNFGMPNPEGYRKALRLMKQAEKFRRPILCFVDTPGAFCGIGAEERGQGEAIAKNLMEMSALTVPVLSIVIGEGGSGGALAMAVGNEVWMLENAIYSVLSPEGFASILWKDSKRAKEAANVMKITAQDLLELGVIEKIIKEPVGGIEQNPQETIDAMKDGFREFLERMSKKTAEELIQERYEKFRKL